MIILNMNNICSTISLIIDDMHYNWKVNIIINAIKYFLSNKYIFKIFCNFLF